MVYGLDFRDHVVLEVYIGRQPPSWWEHAESAFCEGLLNAGGYWANSHIYQGCRLRVMTAASQGPRAVN